MKKVTSFCVLLSLSSALASGGDFIFNGNSLVN